LRAARWGDRERLGQWESAEAAFVADYSAVLAAEALHHFLSSAQR